MRFFLSRVCLILFGVFLLGLAEGTLRLFWVPAAEVGMAWSELDPFREVDGMLVLKEPFQGSLRPAPFAAKKGPQALRIFCFGGSTTFGYPHAAEAAWPRLLARRLQRLYPGREIEVINLGGTSYGSARILGLMRGVLKYQPDLFLAAFGHNEFVEDSFRVAVESKPGGVRALRALYLTKALRQLLPERRGVQRTIQVEPDERGAAGFFFAAVPAGTVYQATPEKHRSVHAALQRNTRAMIELASSHGIDLVLATVPSSLINWPPEPDAAFPPDPQARQAWQSLVARAEAAERAGRAEAALKLLREAVRLWDGNASLAFRLGSVLLAHGHQGDAIPWLERARDLDPVPVRATSVVSEEIRAEATAAQVPLADCARTFIGLAPTALTEADLLLDHVHPTAFGQVVLAREVWRAMTKLEEWRAFSAAADADLAAYEENVARISPPLDEQLAFVWGQVYARKGMLMRAEAMFRQSMALGNHTPFVRMYLADVLVRQGRPDEAQAILETLVREQPGFAEPLPMLGSLREQSGDLTGALQSYQRAFVAGNTARELLLHLGLLLVEAGRADEAAPVVQRALEFYPGDCDLLVLAGRHLELIGRSGEAARRYEELLQVDPACHNAWESLGLLQMNSGEWAAAAKTFQAALQAPGAQLPNHHLNLGYVYWQGLGDSDVAIASFRRYLALQPDGADNLPPELRERVLESNGSARRVKSSRAEEGGGKAGRQ